MSKDFDNDQINAINIINKEESTIDIYIISCFHKIIWENKLLNLISPNKSVTSIITKIEQINKKNNNYIIKLHQININNNYNDIEKINLYLSHKKDDDLSLNVGDISIKLEEEKFYFKDINLELNDLKELKKIIKEDIVDDKNIKYYLELDFSTKLKIYKDFLEKNNIIKIYSPFLVNNFLFSAKNNIILYSDIITLFTLSNGNKSIINFFDNCYNFKYIFNKFKNENFNNLLGLYLSNKDEFNAQNEVYFNVDKNSKKSKNNVLVKKYKKDIDNFMSLFILIFEKDKIVDKKNY